MGCSCTGLIAIITCFIAVVLSAVSIGLPTWSSTDEVKDSSNILVTSAKFTAGVWGYCLNVEYKASGNKKEDEIKLDNCFGYWKASDFKLPNNTNTSHSASHGSQASIHITDGVCDLYQSSTSYAQSTGIGSEDFSKFMDRACGSFGKATVAFAGLALGFGVLAFASLLFFITCCANKSCFVGLAKGFTLLGFVCSLIAFLLWIGEAKGLKNAGIGYGSAWYLQIASCIMFLVSLLAVFAHMRQSPDKAQA